MKSCRGCGGHNLELILDLGLQPPSNAFKKVQYDPELSYPLRAVYCTDCFLMQIDTDLAPSTLFGAEYVYFSQNSSAWLEHTRLYCEMARKRFSLNTRESIVTEVGGNDGHLLKNLKDHVLRAVNIEPSASVAKVSTANGVETWVEYYGPQQMQSDLIIVNNVTGHVPDLDGFVRALYLSLKPTGTITLEFPHALRLLQGVQFDTIYHEHYSYLSLTALKPILERNNLHAYDVETLATHGGSLRLYIGRAQEVQQSIHDLLAEEAPLRYPNVYKIFAAQTYRCRADFLQWFLAHGRNTLAYGAAAKGNTFLNFCGMTARDIRWIADTTKAKQGLYLPGSCIPVIDEATVLAKKPDWLLVLPWNWSDEIVQRIGVTHPKQKLVSAVPHIHFF